MANLFLDGIYDNNNSSPNSIQIFFPTSSGGMSMRGLIVGEFTFSAQNKWGPIISDLTNLQDFSSMMGSASMFSWIGASTMCWKGTNPLSIAVDMYFINYKKGLKLEEKLKQFIKLASLDTDPNASLFKDVKVLIHGGYAADLLASNQNYFDGSKSIGKTSDFGAFWNIRDSDPLIDAEGNAQGSVSFTVGNKITIRNLLLSKIDVTPSLVQVASSDGSNALPLYYKVNAAFTGVRPLLTTDVDYMFRY